MTKEANASCSSNQFHKARQPDASAFRLIGLANRTLLGLAAAR